MASSISTLWWTSVFLTTILPSAVAPVMGYTFTLRGFSLLRFFSFLALLADHGHQGLDADLRHGRAVGSGSTSSTRRGTISAAGSAAAVGSMGSSPSIHSVNSSADMSKTLRGAAIARARQEEKTVASLEHMSAAGVRDIARCPCKHACFFHEARGQNQLKPHIAK